MKTEVYSWRISRDRKAVLEREARREGISLSGLLERITERWLQDRRNDDEAEQAELRRRVMATVGTIRGGDPTRSQRARELVREIIHEKHQREANAARRAD